MLFGCVLMCVTLHLFMYACIFCCCIYFGNYFRLCVDVGTHVATSWCLNVDMRICSQ